ncbi:CBS domain-containing protein [Candidatus Woesebacteria bacterium]|nr:CBS domain-containing protein [Candidatus Woesebacteria bacterium]
MKNIRDFLKKNNIIRVTPDDTLSSAIGQLSSSHDAAFVFDSNDVFHGIVNPYYALIQSGAREGNTKVETIMYHPPKIYSHDTLERIAEMMISSKVHYLPVFDEEDEFVGITSARRLMSLMKDSVSKIRISQLLQGKKRPILTILETATIAQALQIFQKDKVSKLVVVDEKNKLRGVLSYYDLLPYIIAPGNGKGQEKGQDNEKAKPFDKLLVRNYMKKLMITMDGISPVSEAIAMMLDKKIGSVIMTDSTGSPVNILTTRDILGLLKSDGVTKEVKLTIKHFNPAHKAVIDEFADHIREQIREDDRYVRAELIVDEEKEGKLYHIAVHLVPQKGKLLVFDRQSKDLPTLLKELKELIRREK